MLILVGVTVTVALNGGLFEKARQGAKETTIEREKEELALAVASAYDVATGKINKDELEKALGEGWQVNGNEGGPYTVTSPNKNIYEISADGTITYLGVAETVTALEDDNDPLTIGAIEDLVDLAIAVNNGETYEGKTITLLTSLDFNNKESYRTQNPETTAYKDKDGNEIDINGDGTVEAIMKELTEGLGFMPIGNTDMENGGGTLFGGTFEGNGKTISNLYINRPEGIASLFGGIGANTTIQNLTIQEPKICGMYSTGLAIGMSDLEQYEDEEFELIDGKITIKNCSTKGGKIGAVNENCVSNVSGGLVCLILEGEIEITDCKNESVISGLNSFGVASCVEILNKITVKNCSNYGEIIVEDEDYEYDSMVGCVVVAASKEAEVTNCSNHAKITGAEDCRISGVVEGSGVTVSNCVNYGKITALRNSDISGIFLDPGYDVAGDLYSQIKDSRNYGEIVNMNGANGGLCLTGVANGVPIVHNCSNYGNITAYGYLGGSGYLGNDVAGICLGGFVSNCINYGNLKIDDGNQEAVACGINICGRGSGYKVINCTNYGEIEAPFVAGIASGNEYQEFDVDITNCYNIGNIKGRQKIYGISYTGNIKNCYNLGEITEIEGYTTDNKAPITTEGTQTNCYALTGEETNEEKTTLLNSLNSNREDTATWSEWKIDSNLNNGYPVFKWQNAEE